MGKLYQNKWAGYETYFTPCFPVRTRKNESDAIGGYEITNVDGKWKCRKAQYYLHTMRDEEHFPVVGEVKINVLGYVMDTMLNALERRTDDIDDAPTIEPQRKRGHWIRHPEQRNIFNGKTIECSECHEKYTVQYVEDELFCRHCGADMGDKG